MPEGTHFSIDCHAFVVGPNFRGVKMIPPGPHFVCYRFVSVLAGPSTRVNELVIKSIHDRDLHLYHH